MTGSGLVGSKPLPASAMMASASSRLIGNDTTRISMPEARGILPSATSLTMSRMATICWP